MGFTIRGLDPARFRDLYGMDAVALAGRLARRVVVDAAFGYPDRVGMRDAAIGETLLLVHHVHQPAATPYRASHAVFVREGAEQVAECTNQVPPMLARRMLARHGFDREDTMTAAELVPGEAAAHMIEHLLARRDVTYLHAHFAVHGCFAVRIDRI